jgi:hypothetical protein
MLNAPIAPVSTYTPRGSPIHRKRGGQPSNHNALQHSLFALKNPTTLTSLSSSATKYWQLLDKSPQAFWRGILELQKKIDLMFRLSEKAENDPNFLAWYMLILRMNKIVACLSSIRYSRQKLVRNLLFVTKNAPALIRYDFHLCGITRDADSFPIDFVKSDLNSQAFQGPICFPG